MARERKGSSSKSWGNKAGLISLRVQHLLEYLLFLCASTSFGILPLNWVRRVAANLGEHAYRVGGLRAKITRENLRLAFPQLEPDRLEAIARSSFRHVATTLVELLYFPHLTQQEIQSFTSFSDENLFQRLQKEGKGVILLTSHLGSWEIVPIAIHLFTGIQVSSVYKAQSNRFVDEEINRRRTLFGTRTIPMGLAVRDILKTLQKGEAVLMAADQSAPKESIWLEFFGRSVPVFQGPASFCLKTGAPLVLAHAVRLDDGSYQLRCTQIRSDDLSDSEEGIRELTRRHLEATEGIIREVPGQWMWMHRRWKHAVAGEAEK
jgi:Kdo2-lipid IVA lauroyltransferase/acyltransferase